MYPESMKPREQVGRSASLDRPSREYRRLDREDCECASIKESWHESQRKLQQMANQLLSIQENERKRIATDLHDGVGQSLTMIKLSLAEVIKQLSSGAVAEAGESLQLLKLRVHGALDEVRHVAMDLRPPMLDDLGLLPTLSWFFRELEAVCPGMKVEREFGIHESNIPAPLKITIFRILQEATSNIVKYANADLMRVKLKMVDDAIHFSIEDNGAGFNPAEVAIRDGSDRGLGLLSMKERAHLSGGAYVMDSVSGKGTQIRVSWHL